MDNELYDGIEWEIDGIACVSSSGDNYNEWIHEFRAVGRGCNGNKIYGVAYYTENDYGVFFNYVDYEEEEYEELDEEDDEW